MSFNALRRFVDRLRNKQSDSTATTQILQSETTETSIEAEDDSQEERYRLEKRLGGGGMGEVWLATDTLLNRPVAIKYLKATQDIRYKELFLSEARILAQINHPNITLIYDAVFDQQRQGFYLVMEYVEGKPLSDLIDERSEPLPLDLTLDVAVGTLRALQYAHNKGIVHRDIKPANVMLQEDQVKLTDFGIAGLMTLLAQGEQQLMGTPSYMSPEQIDGAALDGRSDLYSLGVMLFEMLSGGRLPFEHSDTLTLFDAHQHLPPPPLSQFARDIPLALEQIVMELLVKNPADRYASAEAALNGIEAFRARQWLSQPHLDLLDLAAHPLVGRERILNDIESLWTEIRSSGRPRLLVATGEKGVGKSRLVAQFLGQSVIDKGFIAVAGSSDEASGPYAPFAEILATVISKGLARDAISQERIDLLVAHIPDLPRLLNLSSATKSESESTVSTETSGGIWQTLSEKMSHSSPQQPFAETQQQLFSTILTILNELGPTAILLERASHLEEASAALVGFLIRQKQLPLLIIAACRDTGTAIPWLDSFSADEKEIITIPPLPAEAVKAYLPHLTGGPVSGVVVESVMERSRGNPLRVEEVTRHLIEAKEIRPDETGQWRYVAKEFEAPPDAFLPKSVLGAFARRLEQLDESSREALTIAALAEPGAEFSFDLWVIMLGGQPQRERARQVLDEAVRQRVVRRVSDNRYAFRVADVDKALIATMPETHRRDIHRRIAETLRQQQADPALIQYHQEQAT